jgi:hypothetical protein
MDSTGKVVKGILRDRYWTPNGRASSVSFHSRPTRFSSPYVAATHELRPRQWLNLSRIEERI